MLAWGSLFMYCDYHTHTPLCLHASGTPQEYVQSAVRAGLREYGISDHAPMQEEPFDDWRMKQADMGAYLDWIREATELAAPHGLTVKAGLECDWFPGIEPWTDHLRGLYEWDYLIGSVHYLGKRRNLTTPTKWISGTRRTWRTPGNNTGNASGTWPPPAYSTSWAMRT